MKLSQAPIQDILDTYQLDILASDTEYPARISLSLQVNRSARRVQLQLTLLDAGHEPIVSSELIDPIIGLNAYQVNNLAGDINLPFSRWHALVRVTEKLYRVFLDFDCERLEVYRLQYDGENDFSVYGVKMWVDNNASHRQDKLKTGEFPSVKTIQYIELDGQIACIGNGAGLIMSLMDAIRFVGKAQNIRPACFLEVEDSNLLETLEYALDFISVNASVRCLAITLLSMWYPADVLADYLIKSVSRVNPVYLVVHIEGLNAADAYQRLILAGHPSIIPVRTMTELAEKAVRIVGEAQ